MIQKNTYDHNGKRIKKKGQDGISRYYFYDHGNISYTMDGTDELSVSSSNILTPGGSVAATIRNDSYHTYLKDIQGSTGSIVKEDGNLSAAYKYSDFGETEEVTDGTFDNEICYTGQVYDDETGLYYYNARYYDPINGRFISQDVYRGETSDPGTWHLYAYCANDPINYVDPSGHKKAFIGWGIQLETSLKCGFYGLHFIWFNNKVDKRLDGYKFHLYTYGGLSYPTEEKTKIRNQIKNNPKRLKTKDGLKKICKKLKKNTSLAACIIAIWAETDKFNSYEDYEDGFIAFTLTTYHATLSFGVGSSSVVVGFGISSSKVSVSISAGITTFRKGLTRGLRNSILKIRGYVKGKAEQL